MIVDVVAGFLIPNRGPRVVDASKANTILSLEYNRGIGVIVALHETTMTSATLPEPGSKR